MNNQEILYNSDQKDWLDSSLAPGYASCVSVLWIIGRLLFFQRNITSNERPAATRIAFHIAGCLTLLGLSLATLIKANDHLLPQLAWCATYLYAAGLGVLSFTSFAVIVSYHVQIILLTSFITMAYRNLYPLVTFHSEPRDVAEGNLLWAKVVVLGVISVLIPLVVPRQHIPADPKHPAEAAPEQNCSYLSLYTFAYLDPIIAVAEKTSHVETSQLPPMCDTDTASILQEKSFPHIDAFSGAPKERHIIWGLFYVMLREIFEMIILNLVKVLCIAATVTLLFLMLAKVFAFFAGPISINRLLNYVESDGLNASIRPWFWILLLFAGAVTTMLSSQRYQYLSIKVMLQITSILTQLLYDHTMKIRVKAETSSSTSTVGSSVNSIYDGATLSVDSTGETSVGEHSQAQQSPVVLDNNSASKNLIGKLNNLISTDMDNLLGAQSLFDVIVFIPVQIILTTCFLYTIVGWSAFAGMGTMFLLLPVPGWIVKASHQAQVSRMKETDSRVQVVTESMSVLRMLKLFGWEAKTEKRIAEKREAELSWLKTLGILDAFSLAINSIIPVVTMAATFSVHTLIMGEELHASKIFASITAFDSLRYSLNRVAWRTSEIVAAKVSLDRVNDFLHETELIDVFDRDEKSIEVALMAAQPEDSEIIGFQDAAFTWSQEEQDGTFTPSRRAFKLVIQGRLEFKRSCINLVVGATGSGKTSLLMALLGEMHFVPSPNSWYNLPRGGGIAYAAQQSWVQNETIRDNIVFGAPFDETRYKKVLYQVGLERDLDLFAAGDRTEVGEHGLTLSGGQKARVTLARAVYSHAEIILLDDILAALDVHTARWIVDECLTGDLVHGRTIIMVTHNLALTSPIASFVVGLSTDGRAISQGSLANAIAKDQKLAVKVQADENATANAEVKSKEEILPDTSTDGKLILAEEIEQGNVSRTSLKLLFSALGGQHQIIFWVAFIGLLVTSQIFVIMLTGWLGIWADSYDNNPAAEVDDVYFLGVFGGIFLITATFGIAVSVFWMLARLRSSRIIHDRLVSSVLGSTLRWLDETPTSRIISRCTRDIRSIDVSVPSEAYDYFVISVIILLKLGAVVLFSPIFVIPGLGIFLLGNYLGQRYLKAALSMKRELSIASAPVLGQFDVVLNGLISVRAYGVQDKFRQVLTTRINHYTRMARAFYNLNEWVNANLVWRGSNFLITVQISIRIEALGVGFTVGLAIYLFYSGHGGSSAEMGFSLNMAVGCTAMIIWYIRTVNEFEVACNSLERIAGYLSIEQEAKPTPAGIPPAHWPSSGDLRIENLSARYSKNGPKVLHNLNFHIQSGERVGIVGRTGSGKSSFTLSLLRCILTEGTVYFDGLPTNQINLDRLRESITIIPQVPELLSGSLRQNLDPFGEHDDATLNNALRASGLFSLEADMEDGQLSLDSDVASGGGNLSVGQRQILALARAIVRNSKLLILDEATSAIDNKTDEVIQASLRHELPKDVTLLTVAHRLSSIMDSDKIILLDAGRVVEFGTPRELLKNEKGLLRSLVDESADRDILLSLVQ